MDKQQWKLVPVEPTPEMLDATVPANAVLGAFFLAHRAGVLAIWREMLDAAPTLPVSAGDERKAFEAWASAKRYTLQPDQNNCGLVIFERYGHPTVQRMWEAWQEASARAALAAPSPGIDAPEIVPEGDVPRAALHRTIEMLLDRLDAPALIDEARMLEIFQRAQNGSDKRVGLIRGIRAVLAEYESGAERVDGDGNG